MAIIAMASFVAAGCGSPQSSAADQDQAAAESSPTDSPEQSPPTESPQPPTEPVLERSLVVESVKTSANDLPAEKLGRLQGTNDTSFAWDPDAQPSGPAASSQRVTPEDIASLYTSIPRHGDLARVEATLRNETDDRRLEVLGHITYELRGPGGPSEHSSELLDTELGPGQGVTVVFVLELPRGDYEGSSSFRPSEKESATG
jgi:hypothetical protein